MAKPGDGDEQRPSRFDHLRHPRHRQGRVSGVLALLELGEDAVHLAVAAVLMVTAVLVLYHYGYDFLTSGEPFTVRVTNVINGLLFVVIVMELLHTVVEHFEFAGFQLKPFLLPYNPMTLSYLLAPSTDRSAPPRAEVVDRDGREPQTEQTEPGPGRHASRAAPN